MELLEGGHTLSAVARRVGAAVSAVWQWRENFRRSGAAGLSAKPAPGRPCKLSARQRQRLPKLLARGARAHGYANDLWTTRRIARVIAREFGVDYHPAHVSRILAALRWSYRKPQRRLLERNQADIGHRKRHHCVAIKKQSRA